MDTPYSLVRLEEVDSTQDVARNRYQGVPLLVVADRQTSGRGRSGSGWVNAPQAAAISLCFSPPSHPLTTIPLTAGVAAAEVTGAKLKWPNDLILDGSKVGGILSETSGDLVVVGLGLNIWWPDPPAGVGAIRSARAEGDEAGRLGEDWARAFLRLLERPEWPWNRYERLCLTLGQEITWEPSGQGRAISIDDDGALLVETPDRVTRLTSGAVSHVRSA